MIPRGGYPDESDSILMIIGDLTLDEGPPEGEDIMKGVEGCWIEGIAMIEVILEEEDP